MFDADFLFMTTEFAARFYEWCSEMKPVRDCYISNKDASLVHVITDNQSLFGELLISADVLDGVLVGVTIDIDKSMGVPEVNS